MDEVWIPIIGMICVFGLPIGGWIVVRVLQHQERMAMLQRGIVPPPQGFFSSRRGQRAQWNAPPQQPWSAPGMQAPPPPYAYNYEDPNSPECLLRKGITTAAVGMALFIGLSFIGYHGSDGAYAWHPGPWLLGGLIPLFVGVAQIAIAVLSGAQFMSRRPQTPPGVSPSYNGPFPKYGAPSSPSQPGSAGPRFEELARPVPPPADRP